MTPEERQLISGLFDRMRGFTLADKDGEADALINERVQSLRDAPYMLVQSVLVQEHALQQADARIKDLEEQVRELQSTAQPQPGGTGSFLGGLFGSRPSAEPARGAATSVPAIGARATPSVYDTRQGWTPQGPGQQPGGPFAQAAQQPAGGGFLRSAMTTAAGVAGGVLVAGAISNMLGGHSAQASTPSAGSQPAASEANKDTAQSQDKDNAQSQDAASAKDDAYQDGYQDAVDDSGWGDDGGGDFDI
jgi:uncharacterized protein